MLIFNFSFVKVVCKCESKRQWEHRKCQQNLSNLWLLSARIDELIKKMKWMVYARLSFSLPLIKSAKRRKINNNRKRNLIIIYEMCSGLQLHICNLQSSQCHSLITWNKAKSKQHQADQQKISSQTLIYLKQPN